MATRNLGPFELTLPDDVVVTDMTPGADGTAPRRGIQLPTGPISAAEVFGAAVQQLNDPIVDAFLEQDLVLERSFTLERPAGAPTRALQQPMRGRIDLPEGENAVILLEQDGVYSWRMGSATKIAGGSRVRTGAVLQPAMRRIEFDLELEPAAAPDARRQRGPVVDFVVGRARGWLFRFVARVAADKLVEAMERKKHSRLVAMEGTSPQHWRNLASICDLNLPTDRAARILLFVHGTFSSTLGSYGALGANEWGRAFLANASARYDAVVGFDHRTLSEDPIKNANDLLGLLEHAPSPGIDIDAVTFSRGGLVLRSLVEYLLPSSRRAITVRRAVFIAAANSGTLLASTKNWKVLIDLTTNLVAAASRVTALFAPPAALVAKIVSESIGTLGAFVKVLASAALDPTHVPGLAAMTPDGEFIRSINNVQPGQPAAGAALYYAITSDFNAKGVTDDADGIKVGLVKWLADHVMDAQMGEANDLVVHNQSTLAIDPGTGEFFHDRYHFESNPRVYHTVFFTRPEVASAITKWFGLGQLVATARSTTPSLTKRFRHQRVFVIDTTEPFRHAIRLMQGAPDFIVARRNESPSLQYHYAFRREELLHVAQEHPEIIDLPIGQALESTALRLGEDSSSEEVVDGLRRGWVGDRGPTTGRVVVITGGEVTEVREMGRSIPSAADLAAMQGPAAVLSTMAVPAAARHMPHAKPTYPAVPAPMGESFEKLVLRSLGSFEAKVPALKVPALEDLESYRRQIRRHLEEQGIDTISRPSTGSAGSGEGSVTRVAEGAAPPAPAPPPPTTVYAAAEMQEEIPLGIAVPLSVQVSRRVIAISLGATSAAGEADVDPTLPLIVQVIAKRNVSIGAPDRAMIDPRDDATDLIFDVTGTTEGLAEVRVALRQGPVLLLTLALTPTIVAATRALSPRRITGNGIAESPGGAIKSYPALYIDEVIEGTQWYYSFRLELGPADLKTGHSPRSTTSRDEYVDTLYKKIESFWVQNKKDAEAFELALRTYGGQLFDELVPPAVQLGLWNVRDSLRAIQVVSAEPFIPWELVHLKEPAAPGTPPRPVPAGPHFLGQKGVVRWLDNYGPPAYTMRIRPGRSRYAIPAYPGTYALPYAQQEIPFLKARLRSRPVDPVELNELHVLFASSALDHFHFSGHGVADAKRAVEGRLLLSVTPSGGEFVPRYLDAPSVAQHANLAGGDSRPLVVLNACQVGRLGTDLTSIGGFAEAFVRRGAGAFVGSLWSVGDLRAKDFSEAFYAALLDKRATLAEASIVARDAARQGGDATWMAYVIYGYPLATVTLETDPADTDQ